MVLVIGIVVDDAMWSLKTLSVLWRAKVCRKAATKKKAMGQISGAVIGITAVLMSVFVPLAMFSGATGNDLQTVSPDHGGIDRLLRIPCFDADSGIVCHHAQTDSEGSSRREKRFLLVGLTKNLTTGHTAMKARLPKSCARLLRMMVIYIGFGFVVGVFLFMRLPTSLLAVEDQGNLMLSVQLPAGATKERTDATLAQITQLAKSIPEIENIITVSGFSFQAPVKHGFGLCHSERLERTYCSGSDATSISGKLTGMMMATLKDGFSFGDCASCHYGIGCRLRLDDLPAKTVTTAAMLHCWPSVMS